MCARRSHAPCKNQRHQKLVTVRSELPASIELGSRQGDDSSAGAILKYFDCIFCLKLHQDVCCPRVWYSKSWKITRSPKQFPVIWQQYTSETHLVWAVMDELWNSLDTIIIELIEVKVHLYFLKSHGLFSVMRLVAVMFGLNFSSCQIALTTNSVYGKQACNSSTLPWISRGRWCRISASHPERKLSGKPLQFPREKLASYGQTIQGQKSSMATMEKWHCQSWSSCVWYTEILSFTLHTSSSALRSFMIPLFCKRLF